jgi:hypothetical protein
MDLRKVVLKLASAALSLSTFGAGAAFAADNIRGQVMSGGAPIAESTVTLFADLQKPT